MEMMPNTVLVGRQEFHDALKTVVDGLPDAPCVVCVFVKAGCVEVSFDIPAPVEEPASPPAPEPDPEPPAPTPPPEPEPDPEE